MGPQYGYIKCLCIYSVMCTQNYEQGLPFWAQLDRWPCGVQKSVLFVLERRPFRVNKLEEWQTLYNEELPEKTHSASEG